MSKQSRGSRAELAAAEYLVAQGFDLVGTNVRVGRLEIDVLARRADILVVIEVRTRGIGSFENALESVNWKKRDRIIRAARALWAERFEKDGTIRRLRFDVVGVDFSDTTTRIIHVQGAFTA